MTDQAQMNELRQDIAKINEAILQLGAKMAEPAAEATPEKGTSPELDKLQRDYEAHGEELKSLRAELAEIKSRAKAKARGSVSSKADNPRTWREIVSQNPGFKSLLAGEANKTPMMTLPLDFFGRKDVDAVNLTGAPPAEQRREPWVEDPDQMLFLESLITSYPVVSDTFKVVTESQDYRISTEATAAVGSGDSSITVVNASGFEVGSTIYVGEDTTNSATISSITQGALSSDADTITLTGTTGFTASKGARVWSTSFVPTAEGKPIPYGALKFAASSVAIERIGVIIPATMEALADNAQLQNLLTNRLRRNLLVESQKQILNGTASNNEIQGLLTASGINTYSWSNGTSGDTKLDALRRAATMCHVDYYVPNVGVLNVNDLEDIELTPGSDGHYVFAQVQSSDGVRRAWGMSIVGSNAIASGTALIGDLRQAVEIGMRQDVQVYASTEHEDFFARDMVALKANRRMGLAVLRADALCKVTFDSAPS